MTFYKSRYTPGGDLYFGDVNINEPSPQYEEELPAESEVALKIYDPDDSPMQTQR